MKKSISFLLSIICCFSSCNVLEVEPVSLISSGTFYKNAGDAQAALMNVYNYVQNPVTQNFIAIPELMSDGVRATRGGNFTNHEGFAAQSGQGNISDMWRELYFAIQAANDVIENVPGIDDPALNKDQIVGEAYFLRGMSFFYLTRLFGKIPLPITPSKSANQEFKLSRSEVSVVFEQIIQDLLEAEKRLDKPATNRARASKGTARAMLAKVYLYRNAPGDVELALAETVEVMDDKQYVLVSGANYGSMFGVGAQNTTETIFEISYRPNTANENHQLDAETVPYPNNNPRILPDSSIIDAFNASVGDRRRAASLGLHNGINYARKYERAAPTTAIRGTFAGNVIILRLADIILMRAECLNELGRTPEAIPFLNDIRARAGLAATAAVTQTDVRLAIENERFLELCFEGHRWFDLVRTNRALALIVEAPKIGNPPRANPLRTPVSLTNPNKILWPIPAREIDLNPNLLPQNPSYQ